MEARRLTDILPTLRTLQTEISNCLENIYDLLLMKICQRVHAFILSAWKIQMLVAGRPSPWDVIRGAAGGGLRGGGPGLNTTAAVLGTVTPTSSSHHHHPALLGYTTSYQSGKQKVNLESKIKASASDMYHLSCSTRRSTAKQLSVARASPYLCSNSLASWRQRCIFVSR